MPDILVLPPEGGLYKVVQLEFATQPAVRFGPFKSRHKDILAQALDEFGIVSVPLDHRGYAKAPLQSAGGGCILPSVRRLPALRISPIQRRDRPRYPQLKRLRFRPIGAIRCASNRRGARYLRR